MAETALETHGLTMRFGGVVAADRVDFRLQARELRCLIGPNGAGKSTFFKCITGLQSPSEGEVWMRGIETTGWMPHQVASLGVGIKTQTPNVLDSLSVHENVWLAARRFHGSREADRKTREVIDLLDLGAIAKDGLGRLAHGERQRVELGLVAAGDPWLILLDEPAAGLGAEDVERLTGIIRELNRQAALVIVEHDMQFIRSIAETVTVFHQGKVLIEDHVDRVMSDPVVRNVYLGRKA
ncbi:MAG: ATP-binding cassette domain-containing protein [Boseongicola sp. SB0664_bin_43]|uniref:ATP-binding cassette domain-containing protein n=1 Tax=Boseongicola sp. SB0664_bin_43 TaxID=2604844 RepID=A0A6B0XZ46_9RHOB|nr:ATP-binding cassette domain-containing protein [Boseongicola sp. SB0664_bin_43]MYK30987.1 ATP-binding cassette domain-containing protein [Boseongicola sp. SB0670_bin_30]